MSIAIVIRNQKNLKLGHHGRNVLGEKEEVGEEGNRRSLELDYNLGIEILTRVDANSLCRYNCVSKGMLLLLSDPFFARAFNPKAAALAGATSIDFLQQYVYSDGVNPRMKREIQLLPFLGENLIGIVPKLNGTNFGCSHFTMISPWLKVSARATGDDYRRRGKKTVSLSTNKIDEHGWHHRTISHEVAENNAFNLLVHIKLGLISNSYLNISIFIVDIV